MKQNLAFVIQVDTTVIRQICAMVTGDVFTDEEIVEKFVKRDPIEFDPIDSMGFNEGFQMAAGMVALILAKDVEKEIKKDLEKEPIKSRFQQKVEEAIAEREKNKKENESA